MDGIITRGAMSRCIEAASTAGLTMPSATHGPDSTLIILRLQGTIQRTAFSTGDRRQPLSVVSCSRSATMRMETRSEAFMIAKPLLSTLDEADHPGHSEAVSDHAEAR